MAPKRHRGEGSSSSHSFDRKKFVSEAASIRYNDVMANRTIIPERGFWPGILQGQLVDMVRERGWRVFIRQPEPAVENIVREFYANAAEAVNNVVRVRGKDVSFSPASINSYYELQDEPGLDEYTRYKCSINLDLDELIQTLCRPGATWTFKRNEAVHFPSSDLSRYGKAWYQFLCAKLMPTSHFSEIIRDRAVLLYSLITGKTINVGQVIHKSIKAVLEGPTTTGLSHPSLICGLCEQAGVQWSDKEPIQEPKVLLDERIIRMLKQWDGAPADPRGAGFILNPPPQEHPQMPDELAAMHSDTSPRAPSASSSLTEKKFSKQLRRLQSRMDDQFIQIARRQEIMYEYHINSNRTLEEQFARLNPGQDMPFMPQPPILPAFRQPSHPSDIPDHAPSDDDV